MVSEFFVKKGVRRKAKKGVYVEKKTQFVNQQIFSTKIERYKGFSILMKFSKKKFFCFSTKMPFAVSRMFFEILRKCSKFKTFLISKRWKKL
jgi:hypothetical protein